MAFKRSRRDFLKTALAGVGAVTLATRSINARAGAETPGGRPPNIVLIVSDDQGYNELGVINDNVLTPNLDRLANEGVRLTNFYVPWPACTPSRSGFLTGRYPQRNGTYDLFRNEAPDYGHEYDPEDYAVSFERIGGMDVREITIADVLAEAGYYNGIYGKWDLGRHRRFLPLQRGWREFYGFVNTGVDYYTHERYGVPSMYRDNEHTTEDKGTYFTDLVTREAVRFIDENKDRPFFLYLPHFAPHVASNLDPAIRGRPQAPEEWREKYPEYYEEEALVEGERYGESAMISNRAKRRSHYLGSLTAMDSSIGAVLDRLDEYELTANTLVIFFSDNGGSSLSDNTPLRGQKAQVYEGGVRVCALARFPGRIPGGSVNEEFLTGLELFPTLANIADAPLPSGVTLDGFDMMDMLAGEAPSPRKAMFWKRRQHEAARVGDWKWVRVDGEEELFDLSEDVGELEDLSQQHPEKTEELREAFEDWLHEVMVEAEPRRPFKDF